MQRQETVINTKTFTEVTVQIYPIFIF